MSVTPVRRKSKKSTESHASENHTDSDLDISSQDTVLTSPPLVFSQHHNNQDCEVQWSCFSPSVLASAKKNAARLALKTTKSPKTTTHTVSTVKPEVFAFLPRKMHKRFTPISSDRKLAQLTTEMQNFVDGPEPKQLEEDFDLFESEEPWGDDDIFEAAASQIVTPKPEERHRAVGSGSKNLTPKCRRGKIMPIDVSPRLEAQCTDNSNVGATMVSKSEEESSMSSNLQPESVVSARVGGSLPVSTPPQVNAHVTVNKATPKFRSSNGTETPSKLGVRSKSMPSDVTPKRSAPISRRPFIMKNAIPQSSTVEFADSSVLQEPGFSDMLDQLEASQSKPTTKRVCTEKEIEMKRLKAKRLRAAKEKQKVFRNLRLSQ